MRGATDVRKPGAPTSSSAFGARPGAVSVPPKAGSAATADAKKVGSKPPTRGEKVAKPLERGNKQVRVQSGLSLDQKLDLVGYALMITGVLIFFAIVNPSEGSITATLANLLSSLFGKAGLVAMLVPCFGIGLWLFVRHFNENPLVVKLHRVVGYTLLFLTFITSAHFVVMLNYTVP